MPHLLQNSHFQLLLFETMFRSALLTLLFLARHANGALPEVTESTTHVLESSVSTARF